MFGFGQRHDHTRTHGRDLAAILFGLARQFDLGGLGLDGAFVDGFLQLGIGLLLALDRCQHRGIELFLHLGAGVGGDFLKVDRHFRFVLLQLGLHLGDGLVRVFSGRQQVRFRVLDRLRGHFLRLLHLRAGIGQLLRQLGGFSGRTGKQNDLLRQFGKRSDRLLAGLFFVDEFCQFELVDKWVERGISGLQLVARFRQREFGRFE